MHNNGNYSQSPDITCAILKPIEFLGVHNVTNQQFQFELTGRKKSSMILKEYFGTVEGNNDSSTAKTTTEKISKRAQFFGHLARFHNKWGIRHYILILGIILYALLGGLIFEAVEHNQEIRHLEVNAEKLHKLIRGLSARIFNITNTTALTMKERNNIDDVIKYYYKEMLKTEETYAKSILHKYEHMDNDGVLMWSFNSAIFYAVTLFTTIGYGTIACRTPVGKALSVVYSIIGIPFMLAVLSDVGNILLRYLTKAYNASRRCYWKLKLRYRNVMNIEKSELKFEDAEFPLKMFIPIIATYLLTCSWIVLTLDHQYNPASSKMTFGDAFYFSFMTMATVGLGDVMPNNVEHYPLTALTFPIGLVLLSIFNYNAYKKLENRFISAMNDLELLLERLQQRPQGHMVFRWMAPNIELLAIALPVFDDNAILREQIMQIEEDGYHPGGSTSDRLRSATTGAIHGATLGIFSCGSDTNHEGNSQMQSGMPVFIETGSSRLHGLRHSIRKKLIRRASTYYPTRSNARRIRTLSVSDLGIRELRNPGISSQRH